MRLLVVAALALGACYSPAYRDCDISCAGGTCPSGLVCDHEVCRIEGFSGACGAGGDGGIDADESDPDGDRVFGTADNCPTIANFDQADEDRDGLGDVCDPCPPFGDPADNMDTDGDGVGDGCDPSPNLGASNVLIKNRIEIFAGFNSTMLPGDGIMAPTTAWQLTGGTAVVTNKTSTIPVTVSWTVPAGAISVEVLAHVTPKATGTISPSSAGVVAQLDSNGSSGVGCTIGTGEPTLPAGALKVYGLAAGQVPQMLTGDPYSTATTYTPALISRSSAFGCNEKHAASGLSTNGNVQGNRFGAIATAIDATFDWVMIVSERP